MLALALAPEGLVTKILYSEMRRDLGCYAGSLSPSGGAATSNAFTTPHSIA